MIKTIGKVQLDVTKYSGRDLSANAAVEDEILKIVQNNAQEEYTEAIESGLSWPVVYHLSPLRRNIVDWIPMDKSMKVLEVGSDCGALTGSLCRKAGVVTCVESSKRRSIINATRNRSYDNLTIHVGNLKDIEPALPTDYDYIFLIGTSEKGLKDICGFVPFEELLKCLKGHISTQGRIVIAFETQGEGDSVSFGGRRTLEETFASCGISEYHFYHPYPDVQFMTELYEDSYLPGGEEQAIKKRNEFDCGLAVIGQEFDIKYVKYSNDRAPEYAIRTEIIERDGVKVVRKFPMEEASVAHVRHMKEAYDKLQKRFAGSPLEINKCSLINDAQGTYAEFAFVQGIPLSQLMDACLEREDYEGFYALFEEYFEKISFHSDYPVTDFDLIFANFLVDGDKWTLIDYEWTFDRVQDPRELAYRAVYCYILEDEKRTCIDLNRVLKMLDMTETEAESIRAKEMEFQQFVTGQRLAMCQLRELILGSGPHPVVESNPAKRSKTLSVKSLVKKILIGREDAKYEKLLSDMSVTYEQWVAAEWEDSYEVPDELHTEGYVLLVASRGSVSERAVDKWNDLFTQHPEYQIIYGDEDVRRTHSPWYKPEWSPDTYDTTFYFGSLVAVREELFHETCQVYKRCHEDCFIRLFRSQKRRGWNLYEVLDAERYMNWMSMCVNLAGGYEKNSTSIQHLSHMVFHAEDKSEQLKFLKKARQRQIPYPIPKDALLSVVIPSKDNPELLKKCMDSCRGINLEFIVVDNGSNDENREKIKNLLREYPATYIYESQEFNFSKMCNTGAKAARGQYLLFLNDDVELVQPETLEKMLGMANRHYTGAVGLKLLYPGTRRIQHVGITNLPMGPVHKMQFKEDTNQYYGRNRGRRNVIAVTGACLMVERTKFEEVGGFCEELSVAFNDVDLCFSLFEAGYHNVCVNDNFGYHHESISRGADETKEKLDRLWSERDKLYERHPNLVGKDVYYSENLNRVGLDTSVRPAYVTIKNEVQRIEKKPPRSGFGDIQQDNCLMFRLEDGRENRILGYGVVLGDDNACYEKKLLLVPVDKMGEKLAAEILVRPQLRPDLQENMPDQKNVALSGFHVEIGPGVLTPGEYQVGMLVRNRVTGGKIINWSAKNIYLK